LFFHISLISKIFGIFQDAVFLSGFFKYNLLSLATRQEWCVAKALELISSVGYSLKEMTPFVALGNSQEFEQTIETAIEKSDVKFKLSR